MGYSLGVLPALFAGFAGRLRILLEIAAHCLAGIWSMLFICHNSPPVYASDMPGLGTYYCNGGALKRL